MPSLRSLLLGAALAATISTAVEPPPSYPANDEVERQQDGAEFARLLDQVDPPALHSALHHLSPQKFTHGAFNEDRGAAEQIHRDDPPLATSIVALARRQDNGNISTPVTPYVQLDYP